MSCWIPSSQWKLNLWHSSVKPLPAKTIHKVHTPHITINVMYLYISFSHLTIGMHSWKKKLIKQMIVKWTHYNVGWIGMHFLTSLNFYCKEYGGNVLSAVDQGRMIVYERSEWRAVVNAWLIMQLWWSIEDVPAHLVWLLDHIRWGEGEGMSYNEVGRVNLLVLLWIRLSPPPPNPMCVSHLTCCVGRRCPSFLL